MSFFSLFEVEIISFLSLEVFLMVSLCIVNTNEIIRRLVFQWLGSDSYFNRLRMYGGYGPEPQTFGDMDQY